MIEALTRTPLRLVLLILVSALAGAAAVVAVQALFPASLGSRAEIEQVVHDYVLDNPEILPEAMDRLRDKQTAQVIDANRQAIVDPFGSAWQGAKNPDVNVVVYTDYACVYCRASLPEIAELVKNDPKVRIVYRELPILTEESRTAAEWSLAAAEQGKFQKFHNTLFAAERVTRDAIMNAARTAGLDMDRAAKVAGSDRVAQQIDKNLQLAGQLGMTGTPSWVIGDRVTSGAVPYDSLQSMIDTARTKS
ncbi:DsbA family protein [Stakelama marina]|uniref:Thioredoxin domain-containing protein n=1 Tax=Stakelama marina TaxID=2826939 RepID=A0A8T4IF59_9SPHN|nr:DsbA family protein [Stakelama marina]MBR0553257.1 thioredoxin domain-containing protein [Stakelama marina]